MKTLQRIIVLLVFITLSNLSSAQTNQFSEPEFLPAKIHLLQKQAHQDSPFKAAEDSVYMDALVDSIVIKRANADGSFYKFQLKQRSYDTKNNMTEDIAYDYNNIGDFVSGNRSLMYYNYVEGEGDDLLSQKDRQVATSPNAWINQFREEHVYNEQGQQTELRLQNWQSNTNAWQNFERVSHTYDANGNVTQKLKERWNVNQGAYVNYESEVITYNGNNAESIISLWDANGSTWVNHQKKENFYDTVGNSLGNNIYTWNTGTQSWDLGTEASISYNELYQLTEYINMIYINGQVVMGSRYEYSYTENLHSETNIYNYNIGTAAWDNFSRRLINRDLFGNVIFVQAQNWTNSTWGQTEQTWDYYYTYVYSDTGTNNPQDTTGTNNPQDTTGTNNPQDTTGTNNPQDTTGTNNPQDTLGVGLYDLISDANVLQLGPNPSKGYVIAQFEEAMYNEQAQVNVMDLSGKRVFVEERILEKNTLLDLSSLDTGTYLVEIKTENRRFTTKLVIL